MELLPSLTIKMPHSFTAVWIAFVDGFKLLALNLLVLWTLLSVGCLLKCFHTFLTSKTIYCIYLYFIFAYGC